MVQAIINLVTQIWRELLPFTIINEYEEGVLLRLGRYRKTLTPGLHFKIPIVDNIIADEVVTTTLPLEHQSFCTVDEETITVKCIVKYRIVDIKKYLLDVYDVVDAIEDVSLGVVRNHLSEVKYDEIPTLDLETDMVSEVNEKVHQWGIIVQDITITDLVKAKMYRVFGESYILE